MAGGKVQHISDPLAYRALTSDSYCVVKFTADWCGPCKRIAPVLASLAAKAVTLNFLEVDVDDDRMTNVVKKEGVTAMPTFIFYALGTKVTSFAGASQKDLEKNVKLLELASKKVPEASFLEVPTKAPEQKEILPKAGFAKLQDDIDEDETSDEEESTTSSEEKEVGPAKPITISKPKNIVDPSELSDNSRDPFSASGSENDDFGEEMETDLTNEK